ncbi:MAG: GDSL-type esterase/lipase family protein, partial [Prevotellaceae bacterium]|nr:GDSL-type esterase/lipase family protein [Prevotellaceae bacterium]
MKTTKLILFVMCLFAGAIAVHAQDRDHNERWAKLSVYAAGNAQLIKDVTPVKAAFMGNSITQMWANMRPDFFKNNNYVGRGISGQTTPKMLSRFRLDIVALKPQVVVINGGINDIATNSGTYDSEFTLGSIQSMAEIAHANGIKVILTSVLPASGIPWRKEISAVPEKVDQLNAAIKAYCAAKGFTYVDYYSQLVRKDGAKGMSEQYTTDGVHVTAAG